MTAFDRLGIIMAPLPLDNDDWRYHESLFAGVVYFVGFTMHTTEKRLASVGAFPTLGLMWLRKTQAKFKN